FRSLSHRHGLSDLVIRRVPEPRGRTIHLCVDGEWGRTPEVLERLLTLGGYAAASEARVDGGVRIGGAHAVPLDALEDMRITIGPPVDRVKQAVRIRSTARRINDLPCVYHLVLPSSLSSVYLLGLQGRASVRDVGADGTVGAERNRDVARLVTDLRDEPAVFRPGRRVVVRGVEHRVSDHAEVEAQAVALDPGAGCEQQEVHRGRPGRGR